MSASIDVEGLKELRAAFRRAKDKGLKDELKAANKTAAEIVVERAMPNVPVLSGRLKRSVRALGSQREGRAVAGRAKVDYAAAIHWGRKVGNVGWAPNNRMGANMIAGRPFLWDAAQAAQAEVGDEYLDRMTALLDRAIRGR